MRFAAVALALLVAAAVPIRSAQAQIGSERYAAMVVDAASGQVLMLDSADERRHPASLTKMMTLYMVFEALKDGRITLTTPVHFSYEAATQPPTKLGIPEGRSITVEQAIMALITRSANDVATALAEHLGGSETRFAQMMTLRARALGMTRTTFRNASGLPDQGQVTTARDMVLLGRRLIRDYPEQYEYFGRTSFAFRGQTIGNHNRLLTSYEGADGIKTGYIHASGFNLVASARRGGHRVVAAVFGGGTGAERDRHIAALMDVGFANLGVGRPDTRRTRTSAVVGSAQAQSLRPQNRAAERHARAQSAQVKRDGKPARATAQSTQRRPANQSAARRGAGEASAQARSRQGRS